MKECIISKGFSEVKDSTKKPIRRNLEAEFKENLHIFQDDTGKLLVMPDSFSLHDLAKEHYKLSQELEQMKQKIANDTGSIDAAAIFLRSVIKNNVREERWPYIPASLNVIEIPALLKRFLLCILTGKPQPTDISDRVRCSGL